MALSNTATSTGSSTTLRILTGSSLTTPLLTRFTPSADCKTTLWAVPPTITDTDAIITAATGTGPSSCWLREYAYDDALGYDVPIVFSPGVCKYGYTPASSITFQGATTSLCCIKGLTLLKSGPLSYNCGKTISTRTTIFLAHTGTSTLSTIVESFFWADTPQTVAWASSDLDLFTPASLPLKIGSQASSSKSDYSLAPSEGTGAPAISTESSNSATGLSTGAQAGIGVGAAAVGIAIGALLMWVFIRKRARRHNRLDSEVFEYRDNKDSKAHPDIPELNAEGGCVEIPTNEKAVEVYADVGAEFPQDWAAQEADDDMRHELDASYRGEELDEVATPIDGAHPTCIK